MVDKEKDLQATSAEEVEESKDTEAINRVLAGKNDIFKKHYKLDELGLEFDIELKHPNALEQAKIHAKTALYFDGLGRFMTDSIILAYTTLATLRVCGTKVPDFLQNDEDIYNMNLLVMIGEDYRDWLDTFRY